MEPKPVAILLGGKTVTEDLLQILGRDPAPIVRNRDSGAAVAAWSDGESDDLVLAFNRVQGLFGIAEKIDQDLKHLVPVDRNRTHRRVLTHDLDAVFFEGARSEERRV